MDEIIYEPNDMKKMNKTSIGFRPIKKTYEEKLDNFMAQNNLKYIEPISNTKNKIPTPNSDKGKDIIINESNISNKGNKSLGTKGSNIYYAIWSS